MNKKNSKMDFNRCSRCSGFLVSGIANAETYTVEAGDTLSAIANEKNTTLEKLVELNKNCRSKSHPCWSNLGTWK